MSEPARTAGGQGGAQPLAEPAGTPDRGLRVAGSFVALAGAVVTALIEAFYTPLYVGTVRLPLTVVLAAITNAVLVRFTYRVTGSKLFALMPGLVWMGLMIIWAGPTTEGDRVLYDGFGLLTILAGVGGYTFAAYRLITPAPPPRPPSGLRGAGPPLPSPPPPAQSGGPAQAGPDRGPGGC